MSESDSKGVKPIAHSELPRHDDVVDRRVVIVSLWSIAVALAAGVMAQLLTRLIGLTTNLSFYGRISTAFTSPADNQLGPMVILVPVAGGLIVGLMARYGSKAIRGHGIPEAMEQVLINQSRIPLRMLFLKPISAAIAIGTGGPFGAEGPIIATGGALGSAVGQIFRFSAQERKTLLAAGAAAGMAATFGSPVSAVLLAIELLLFEYRPRSFIPVALAAATATAVRISISGSAPAFAMPILETPGGVALVFYVLIGALLGVASVGVTRLVYYIEDSFEHLPIHWMWWPAAGSLVVGLVGFFAPHTLGVGYDNIDHILGGGIFGRALLFLCVMKFISWSVSLGSGTSGGTLAPLFTIGGAIGALLAALFGMLLPNAGIDPRLGALVGMSAMFAGASRALLASVVFAFETTRQPLGLLPLLGGSSAGFLVSSLLMRTSIMTEKIVRRGVRVVGDYSADIFSQLRVVDWGIRPVVTLEAGATLGQVRAWLATATGAQHQGFPVVAAEGKLVGIVSRRELLDASQDDDRIIETLVRREPVVIHADDSLRQAADQMALAQVGRLPVLDRNGKIVGILSRSDLINAHGRHISEAHRTDRGRWQSVPSDSTKA